MGALLRCGEAAKRDRGLGVSVGSNSVVVSTPGVTPSLVLENDFLALQFKEKLTFLENFQILSSL